MTSARAVAGSAHLDPVDEFLRLGRFSRRSTRCAANSEAAERCEAAHLVLVVAEFNAERDLARLRSLRCGACARAFGDGNVWADEAGRAAPSAAVRSGGETTPSGWADRLGAIDARHVSDLIAQAQRESLLAQALRAPRLGGRRRGSRDLREDYFSVPIAACAAARRAIGTRYGEPET